MNVLVYLGSKLGNKEIFKDAAIEVADWISNKGYGLVYGGNENGLMGILASRVLSNECKVIGVMPKFLKEIEMVKTDLSEFIETDTMQGRKDLMRELSDVCIAIPGGPGTMEEITEAYSLHLVGQNSNACILFNKNGYYNDLKNMYDNMVVNGFLTKEDRSKLLFSEDFNEIDRFIKKVLNND